MRIAPPPFRLARHARLRDQLRANQLDALLVTSLPNVAYLTGLFASAGALVVSLERIAIVTDSRYRGVADALREELPGLDVVITPSNKSYETAIAETLAETAPLTVGFEAANASYRRHADLRRQLAALSPDCQLDPTDGLVETLRSVKDSWELAVLTEAGARLSDAAKCIIPKALAGMRERDVAAVVEAELRRAGFEKPAFDTIVASGPNSAMPHYRAGDRVLTAGDLVVLDFGGVFHGYAVDLTRTITMGPPAARQSQLLEAVAAAQLAAFEAIAQGVPASDIDRAARESLTSAGFGEAFGHGTGHGLGLEVHERPRVAPFRAELPAEPLEPGMVFTIEPGAYFPKWGGARLEDDAALGSSGPMWLTDVAQFWMS